MKKQPKVRTSKVLHRFGEWVVTTYGVENTTRFYPIEKSRLWEQDWTSHLAIKTWCRDTSLNWLDFCEAMRMARVVHKDVLRLNLRRRIANSKRRRQSK